jgi:hypothetical protein
MVVVVTVALLNCLNLKLTASGATVLLNTLYPSAVFNEMVPATKEVKIGLLVFNTFAFGASVALHSTTFTT